MQHKEDIESLRELIFEKLSEKFEENKEVSLKEIIRNAIEQKQKENSSLEDCFFNELKLA